MAQDTDGRAPQPVDACDDDDEAFHRSEQDLSENPSATSTDSSAVQLVNNACNNDDDEAFQRLAKGQSDSCYSPESLPLPSTVVAEGR